MLVGAGVRAGGGPGRLLYSGAPAVERSNYNQHGALRVSLCGPAKSTAARTAGYPNGYENGTAWCLPRKGGGLASHNRMLGTGDLAASIQAARNLEAALTGAGAISNAELALIVSFLAALGGSGDLAGTIAGSVKLESALIGSGDLAADLGAIVGLVASLGGAGTLDGSTLAGLANMAASILSYGELTPEGLRDAVWGALAAGNNGVGTMGEKLNDAGSASNPWTEVIESGYTAAEILRLLAAVAGGKTTVDDLGGGFATVTFRDLADTKDRMVADMTNSERTDVTKDLT